MSLFLSLDQLQLAKSEYADNIFFKPPVQVPIHFNSFLIHFHILLKVTFYSLLVKENYKGDRVIILLKELKFIYGLPHAWKDAQKYIKQQIANGSYEQRGRCKNE